MSAAYYLARARELAYDLIGECNELLGLTRQRLQRRALDHGT